MMTKRIVIDGVGLEVARWDGDAALLPILLLHEGLGDAPQAVLDATRDFLAGGE